MSAGGPHAPSGDKALDDAPWLGTGYNTLPEVFRNTARPGIVAAGRDVTMKQGLF